MTKHVTIQTAQIIEGKTAWGDPRNINITIMTGKGVGQILAPTWALVYGVKLFLATDEETGEIDDSKIKPYWKHYHPITPQQYTDQYLSLLRRRWAITQKPFIDLLDMGDICLCCYCRPGDFCHRHIAAEALQKIAISKGYTVEIIDEA